MILSTLAQQIGGLKTRSNVSTPEERFFRAYRCLPGDPNKFLSRLANTDVLKVAHESFSGDIEVTTTDYKEPLILSIPRLLAMNDALVNRAQSRTLTSTEKGLYNFCLFTLRDAYHLENPWVNAKKIPLAYVPLHAPRFVRRRAPASGTAL